MDFNLSEEQRLLKESVDGLLTDVYAFEQRKKYSKEKGGWSRLIWGRFAEQGLLGLPFVEADGGFGGGRVETMIVMEASGRALVVEPYLATVVIGGASCAVAVRTRRQLICLGSPAAARLSDSRNLKRTLAMI
ncbi:alkylation response protein AidB-like acyl-CoA dehydrogenase [Bradyrhizobium sp. GM6.1]